MKALFLPLLLALTPLAKGQLGLVLPTENTALLEKQPAGYFQFVDRTFEGEKTTPWEGGQFGFVRDPRRIGGAIAYARFHEGLDVKPLRRDAKGDPLDEVRAIAAGQVVYVTASAGLSNYGRYIVVRHDFAGAGAFFSLYAHLREARVQAGDVVKAGQGIGRMGYTGAGIDQRRAHLHVELNILLSDQFEAWHAKHHATANHHGKWNGLNLLGLDLQRLFLAQKRQPALTLPDFIRGTQVAFRVKVPGAASMDMLRRYPWLLGPVSGFLGQPAGWEISFSSWGLPVKVAALSEKPPSTALSWVQDDGIPHFYPTRGLVTGRGPTGQLTAEGLRFVNLLSGLE